MTIRLPQTCEPTLPLFAQCHFLCLTQPPIKTQTHEYPASFVTNKRPAQRKELEYETELPLETVIGKSEMADVLPSNPRTLLTAPKAIPQPIDTRQLAPVSAPASASLSNKVPGVRSGHLNLDTFSPVNQNGSFAFDMVLRSGEVHKRTRKTKVLAHLIPRHAYY